ncbi:hypothetical protein M885DRAFT_613636, partial [Pelagophyceae sp. CCMP2097]
TLCKFALPAWSCRGATPLCKPVCWTSPRRVSALSYAACSVVLDEASSEFSAASSARASSKGPLAVWPCRWRRRRARRRGSGPCVSRAFHGQTPTLRRTRSCKRRLDASESTPPRPASSCRATTAAKSTKRR